MTGKVPIDKPELFNVLHEEGVLHDVVEEVALPSQSFVLLPEAVGTAEAGHSRVYSDATARGNEQGVVLENGLSCGSPEFVLENLRHLWTQI